MKRIIYSGLIVLGSMAACHSVSDQKKEEKLHDGVLAESEIKEIDSARLIVAGERAGKLYLGQDMQEVFKILGKPNEGDAAMGRSLGIWYTKSSADTTKRNPVAIFSSYRDSNMVAKAVKQLSVSAPEFSTIDGIHTGTRLSELTAVYPAIKKTMVYVNEKSGDSLYVYDNQQAGIAFDMQKDTCNAITVHAKNVAVNSTYLSLHPGWKLLPKS